MRMAQVARGGGERRLRPDGAIRARIAVALGLLDLPELEADLEVAPWRDGAQVRGLWRARVIQTCGVTLEPLESTIGGAIDLRCVTLDTRSTPARPSDANAPRDAAQTSTRELVIDPDGEDPPDVLDDDRIDLGAYVVEHLALELDPFPRKPDAVFEPPPAEPAPSAFSALAALRPPRDAGA